MAQAAAGVRAPTLAYPTELMPLHRQGLLGLFGRDEAEIARLQKEGLPSCERLRKFGFGRTHY
jgi:hypothetical protein